MCSRGDHLGRLHDCWRKFGRKFRVAQPKAPHGDRLEDNVQRDPQFNSIIAGQKSTAGEDRRALLTGEGA